MQVLSPRHTMMAARGARLSQSVSNVLPTTTLAELSTHLRDRGRVLRRDPKKWERALVATRATIKSIIVRVTTVI